MNRRFPGRFFAALLFFYLCWGVPQAGHHFGFLGLLPTRILFSIVYTGIAGCLIPLTLRRTVQPVAARSASAKSRAIGILVLVGTLGIGLIGSESLPELLQSPPDFLTVVRYGLLFFPMVTGISLFAYSLLPRLIQTFSLSEMRRLICSGALTFLLFFFGFVVDTVMLDIPLALILGLIGGLIGIAHCLIGSFWLSWAVFYMILMGNTLAEGKYHDHPLWLAILSSCLTLFLLIYDQRREAAIRKTDA